jgi:hypothetical protein
MKRQNNSRVSGLISFTIYSYNGFGFISDIYHISSGISKDPNVLDIYRPPRFG